MAQEVPPDQGQAVEEQPQRRRVWTGPFRSVVLPLLMVAAIAAAIWWLEYRPGVDGGRSLTGARFGPIDLPTALVPPGMAVGPEAGKLAPDFLLETLDGGEMRLSDLRGKAVVVNFWATWCVPCRKEIPQLVAAYDSFRNRGLVILGVNFGESENVVQPFAQEFGMNFPVLLDRTGAVVDRYRLFGLPTTYFVDAQGVVRSVFLGQLVGKARGTSVQEGIEKSELEQRIEEILP